MYWTVNLSHGGPRRVNHAAVAIGKCIFTIGGFCIDEDYTIIRPIDVHIIDTVKLKWWKIEHDKDQDNQLVPFQRFGHTVVAQDSKIYLWGGRVEQRVCNTLYCFDVDTLKWSTPTTYGNKPIAKDGHSACIINNCMYVFGGFEEQTHKLSQDLYKLNLHTMIWSLVKTKGRIPSHRDFHTATAIGNKMYVYGGRSVRDTLYLISQEYYCPDIFYYNTVSETWICLTVFGFKPMARRSHSAFVHEGLLYIFGGYNRNFNKHLNDLSRYDPETSSWMTIIPKGLPPCARRRQICLVVDDRVFISGGTSPVGPKIPISLTLENFDVSHYIFKLFENHDDLHVLDLNPSLLNMCLVHLWQLLEAKKICTKDLNIPLNLKNDLIAVGSFKYLDFERNKTTQ